MKTLSLLLPTCLAGSFNYGYEQLLSEQFCFSSLMETSKHNYFFYENLLKPMVDNYIMNPKVNSAGFLIVLEA
jgi:hypothetical protein